MNLPGRSFIKVSSILFIIGAIVGVVVYPVMGLLLTYATIDTGEGTGWLFVVVCILYLVMAVLQLFAAIKGLKGCNSKSAAPDLISWGKVMVVLTLLVSIVNVAQNLVSGESVAMVIIGAVVSFLFPVLYLYGANLNANAKDRV